MEGNARAWNRTGRVFYRIVLVLEYHTRILSYYLSEPDDSCAATSSPLYALSLGNLRSVESKISAGAVVVAS